MFIFPLSYSLSRTATPCFHFITIASLYGCIASLHHHRNPLFSKKNGQNQFQVIKFFNFHPSISGVFNFTIASLDQPFQFHVFSISGNFC
ncbi:hypothetical protein P8452_17357 [Trifolium repens]|nr:hypothetical protein P8452_17357 [Trifolium repens]